MRDQTTASTTTHILYHSSLPLLPSIGSRPVESFFSYALNLTASRPCSRSASETNVSGLIAMMWWLVPPNSTYV